MVALTILAVSFHPVVQDPVNMKDNPTHVYDVLMWLIVHFMQIVQVVTVQCHGHGMIFHKYMAYVSAIGQRLMSACSGQCNAACNIMV